MEKDCLRWREEFFEVSRSLLVTSAHWSFINPGFFFSLLYGFSLLLLSLSPCHQLLIISGSSRIFSPAHLRASFVIASGFRIFWRMLSMLLRARVQILFIPFDLSPWRPPILDQWKIHSGSIQDSLEDLLRVLWPLGTSYSRPSMLLFLLLLLICFCLILAGFFFEGANFRGIFLWIFFCLENLFYWRVCVMCVCSCECPFDPSRLRLSFLRSLRILWGILWGFLFCFVLFLGRAKGRVENFWGFIDIFPSLFLPGRVHPSFLRCFQDSFFFCFRTYLHTHTHKIRKEKRSSRRFFSPYFGDPCSLSHRHEEYWTQDLGFDFRYVGILPTFPTFPESNQQFDRDSVDEDSLREGGW